MELSSNQTTALDQVAAWLKDPDGQQIFRLFGWAGTGKTTIAKHLADGCDGEVLFAAFTGKAAHVMDQKGCTGASTLHSLIYNPKGKSETRLMELRERRIKVLTAKEVDREKARGLQAQIEAEELNLRRPSFTINLDSKLADAELLIVDECSMVNEELARDVLYFNTPVLVLGDPAQLPPVGGVGYFIDAKPDVQLTEVHRHALESPIYRFATDIRNGVPLGYCEEGDSYIRPLEALTDDEKVAADQIIVGKNVTRRRVNQEMRALLGFAGEAPEGGERLVCLRNNRQKGILNGSIWNVAACDGEIDEDTDTVDVSLAQNGEEPIDLSTHMAPYRGDEVPGTWNEKKIAEEFDFGYALTCHKSQGSQWNHVLVYDEASVFSRRGGGMERRWRYTAITRAAETVKVFR